MAEFFDEGFDEEGDYDLSVWSAGATEVGKAYGVAGKGGAEVGHHLLQHGHGRAHRCFLNIMTISIVVRTMSTDHIHINVGLVYCIKARAKKKTCSKELMA